MICSDEVLPLTTGVTFVSLITTVDVEFITVSGLVSLGITPKAILV